MILAPYYVIWAFITATLLFLSLGLGWMLAHDFTRRMMSFLWLSDGVAFWMGFITIYHTLFQVVIPHWGILLDPLSLWILWGIIGVYTALRLLPTPLKNQQVLLAFVLASWGWGIGAGYQFIGEMESDMTILAKQPRQVFSQDPNLQRPLLRAQFLIRLDEKKKKYLKEITDRLRKGEEPDPGKISMARQVLLPEVIEHYLMDLSRLHTYQILQIFLLGAVLMGWGFGRRPEI